MHMSLIALSGFIYLSDELIIVYHWCLCNLQPYKFVILVKIATKLLNVALNMGRPGRIW